MQDFEASDFEASDDVVSTNIDTTITPIRMGSLRLRSDTSVAPAPTAYATESKTPRLRLIPGMKGQYPCLLTVISGIMMPPAGVDRAWDEAASKQGTPDGLPDRSSHPITRHPARGCWRR